MKRNALTRRIARSLPFPVGVTALWSLILIVLTVILMVLSTVRPEYFAGIRSALSDRFAPLLSAVSLPFENLSVFMGNIQGMAILRAESERLKAENVRLREWYHMALLLESENKSLRELLNLKADPEYEYVTARIIAGAGQNFVKSILVSVGQDQGIAKGDTVLSGEGLLGRVVESGEVSARILLLTDINSRVPVIVEDTLIHAIMRGTNADRTELIHYSKDSDIPEGARIVTSGHGGGYPPGLPVGRVVTDEKGVKTVELFADITRQRFVRVMKLQAEKIPYANILVPLNEGTATKKKASPENSTDEGDVQ